jgi:hypothetical protein
MSVGRHAISCGWFWVWAIVGATGALGLVSFGLLGIAPAAIVGSAMSANRTARSSRFGRLAGAGFVCLFVAYVQRAGPGTTCWRTATAGGCDQHLNPIPWLAVGLVLVIGAFILHGRQRG